jgi:RimJ/RimL family protein N-acetyltransferase
VIAKRRAITCEEFPDWGTAASVFPGFETEWRVSFDLQPVLKGELLTLRPLRPEDFPGLFAVAADPLIWEQHPARDRYMEDVFRTFFREAMDSGGALIATDSKAGQVIGSSRFHGYDEEASEIEIGWTFLARSHWGGIYNKEMKQLMLRHAFQFVSAVVFLVGPQNLRSQRALEKIGGVCVGSRRDGSGRDSIVYRITASTFAQGPLGLRGVRPDHRQHREPLALGEPARAKAERPLRDGRRTEGQMDQADGPRESRQ